MPRPRPSLPQVKTWPDPMMNNAATIMSKDLSVFNSSDNHNEFILNLDVAELRSSVGIQTELRQDQPALK
jgi:hypothetical protein